MTGHYLQQIQTGQWTWNVTTIKISHTKKITKPETSSKMKCHHNWNANKTEISLKLKCTKAKNSTKPNVTKTEMSPKLKLDCTTGLSNLPPGVWQWLPWPCLHDGDIILHRLIQSVSCTK